MARTSAVYVEDGDWLVLVCDNATANFYRAGANAFTTDLTKGFAAHQSSAFTLPATATPATGAAFSLILAGVA